VSQQLQSNKQFRWINQVSRGKLAKTANNQPTSHLRNYFENGNYATSVTRVLNGKDLRSDPWHLEIMGGCFYNQFDYILLCFERSFTQDLMKTNFRILKQLRSKQRGRNTGAS